MMSAAALRPALWLHRLPRVGVLIVGTMLALAVLIPAIGPYDPDVGVAAALLSPSLEHPFGTDHLGRDVFTRAFAAARLNIGLTLAGVLVPMVVGSIVGAIAGTTSSRLVDALWMALVDAVNSIPLIILAMALLSILGAGILGLLLSIWLVNWARYARIARAKAQILNHAEFVDAARVAGYSRTRIIGRHILPNTFAETVSFAISDLVLVVSIIAGLSFLGLGARPPAAEWGVMMADARLLLASHAWLVVAPGVLLTVTAVGFDLAAKQYRISA
jgi:peptide/nickel transport system permease protein